MTRLGAGRLVVAAVAGALLGGGPQRAPEAAAFAPGPACTAFVGSCEPVGGMRASRRERFTAGGQGGLGRHLSRAGARRLRCTPEHAGPSCDTAAPKEQPGASLEAEWAATEITGDQNFDTAWMAAWKNKDRIRCPFFKRRATDLLEAALAVGRFILARHKSLLSLAPRSKGGPKATGLSTEALLERIRSDFEERRYYITGKLSREIYNDACFFDAPDPDMPVHGLEKYIDAISNLFEPRASCVELLDLQILAPDLILSRWRLDATLKLPWRPRIKAYTGVTLYELDRQGLIARHTELWSISALDAFVSAVLPNRPGAAPPAPPAAALMELPPHRRSPDPYPLFRAAAANRLRVPMWSSAYLFTGLRR